VSISGGEIIEVKGVQKLDLLSKIITYEAERQAALKTIAKLLSERKATQEAIPVEPVDISRLMEKTKSKVLRKVLDTGGVISAAALPSFRGLLALEPYPGVRLGKELADVARTHGLGGIIHSDELPAYGIELDEVTMIARQLSLDDDDAFVILAGNRETTGSAGRALLRRVREAFRGPIAETRGPTSDGQTRYLRPRPGAARLYPETDVPPIRIEEDYIAMVKKHLPPTWHTQIEELTSQHGLAHPVAEELLASDYLDLFQRLVKETHLSAPYLAASLIETLKALSREGVDLDSINDDELAEFFLAIDSGRIAKEGFPDLVREYAKDHSLGMEAVITRLGLSTLSEEEVRVAIRQEIEASRDLIRSRGRDAFKGLMGSVMAKMRGRIDGKKVSSLLQEEIETFMRKSD
jgi:glutamyl-tRNA(Gln) amidotransferase subunit E